MTMICLKLMHSLNSKDWRYGQLENSFWSILSLTLTPWRFKLSRIVRWDWTYRCFHKSFQVLPRTTVRMAYLLGSNLRICLRRSSGSTVIMSSPGKARASCWFAITYSY